MKTQIIELSLAVLSLIAAIITQHIALMTNIADKTLALNRFDYLTFMFTLIAVVQLGFFIYSEITKDKLYG